MIGMIRGIAAISSVALVAAASMSLAQSSDPEMTGFMYTYYADAAKTQYQGRVSDTGCGETGGYVYVVRANVPSPYYDAEPIFTCSGGQIGPMDP